MVALFAFPKVPGRSFDDETTALMCEAFDKSCQALQGTDQLEPAKEIIAKRIIEMAGRGERDPDRMCEAAMRSIGIRRNMAGQFII
jgi:hypothetical protein